MTTKRVTPGPGPVVLKQGSAGGIKEKIKNFGKSFAMVTSKKRGRDSRSLGGSGGSSPQKQTEPAAKRTCEAPSCPQVPSPSPAISPPPGLEKSGPVSRVEFENFKALMLRVTAESSRQIALLNATLAEREAEIRSLQNRLSAKPKVQSLGPLKTHPQVVPQRPQKNAVQKPMWQKVPPRRRRKSGPPLRLDPKESLKIVEEEICKQLKVSSLADLEEAKFLTKDCRQTLLEAGSEKSIIQNHHCVYIENKIAEYAVQPKRSGTSRQGYYHIGRFSAGPSIYEQIKNTEKPNCPPGPLACHYNDGYASYKPGACYLSLLDVAIQTSAGVSPVVLDVRPIQKRLRALSAYVGTRTWAQHNHRRRSLAAHFAKNA